MQNLTKYSSQFFDTLKTMLVVHLVGVDIQTWLKSSQVPLTQFDPQILISDVYDGKIKY
jgi:hypothetical protein